MGTARRSSGASGIQTAGLVFGGYTTVVVNNTEEYDGSAWTAGGSLNTAREGVTGAGTQTAGLAFGGLITVAVSNTEQYDGSNWISASPRATAKYFSGGAGTQTSGLAFGGGSYTTATEEWTGTPSTGTASTLTTS
jgi:hypothetical protein